MRRLLKTHPASAQTESSGSGSPVVHARITVGCLRASLLSLRDSGTHPPACQDLFLNLRRWSVHESQPFCGRAMWVEMDGGGEEEGQEMRGSWSLGTSLHAPSLTHLSFRCRDGREGSGGGGGGDGGGVGGGGMLRTSRVSWWIHDSQRRVMCVGVHLVGDVYGHTQVDVIMLCFYMCTSCAPDNPRGLQHPEIM